MRRLWLVAVVVILAGAWEFLSAIYAAWRSVTPVDDPGYFQSLATWRYYAAISLWIVAAVLLVVSWWHRRRRSN